MLITKVLETTIDLFDSSDIYHSDIDALVLEKLKKKFVVRCFQSILITDVVRIIRRSIIKMSHILNGAAYIDVQFEVIGHIFAHGEILHGCEIVDVQSNKTCTAKHQYAGIILKPEHTNTIFGVLKCGLKIPVVIEGVRYTVYQTEVSITGTPYIPIVTPNTTYSITNGLSQEEINKLTNTYNSIREEEEKHKPIMNSKSYALFKTMMYPFVIDQKYHLSKVATTLGLQPIPLDIKALSAITTGTIMYPVEDDRYQKRIFHSNKVDVSTAQLLVDSQLYPVLADIMLKYLLYLQALRGFVEQYPTAEAVQENISYWKLCTKAKR